MGWLYLTGQSERMMELIKKCVMLLEKTNGDSTDFITTEE